MVWQSVLASEPTSQALLTKLETIVRRIQTSIPKDAQARQLHVRPQSGPATRTQKLWDFLLVASGQLSMRNQRVLARYPSSTLGMFTSINRQHLDSMMGRETGKDFAPSLSKAVDNFLLPLLGSENEEDGHDFTARLRNKWSDLKPRWDLLRPCLAQTPQQN